MVLAEVEAVVVEAVEQKLGRALLLAWYKVVVPMAAESSCMGWVKMVQGVSGAPTSQPLSTVTPGV
jgi:hypothetical protein